MKTLVVRTMQRDDLDLVAQLESAEQQRPWSRDVFENELGRDDRIYLAAIDEALAGFGGVMLVDDEAHVTNLLVAPGRRRKGVASKLLESLISESVRSGAKHLTLEVRSKNEAARRLYASFGLAPVGMRPSYYGDDDALIMWKHDIDQSVGVRR